MRAEISAGGVWLRLGGTGGDGRWGVESDTPAISNAGGKSGGDAGGLSAGCFVVSSSLNEAVQGYGGSRKIVD